jgi:hypothetical protein
VQEAHLITHIQLNIAAAHQGWWMQIQGRQSNAQLTPAAMHADQEMP